MRPTLEDIKNETKFRKVADFHVDDTMKFLMNPDEFGKPISEIPSKKSTAIAKAIYVLFSIVLGFFLGTAIISGGISALQLLLWFLVFMFIVLPIHEGIHALVFKAFKANDVGFGIAPKAGMVYAYAQNFPITMKELIKVAIMPFGVITPILIFGLYAFPGYFSMFLFLLIIHTIACMGDFALVKYGYKNRNKNIYTYDDIRNEKRTYYLESIQNTK
jgi:Putative zincin peptidase